MNDSINRKGAINAVCTVLYPDADKMNDAKKVLKEMPPAQPTEASCWGCNCPKMERLKEKKTFSEMVHLHDAETHDKRTETHSCDTINRQAAIDAMCAVCGNDCDKSEFVYNAPQDEQVILCPEHYALTQLPSAQKKGYTKADYIMALHKEYGCSLARAEEAHQKALEYLRNTSMMKG